MTYLLVEKDKKYGFSDYTFTLEKGRTGELKSVRLEITLYPNMQQIIFDASTKDKVAMAFLDTTVKYLSKEVANDVAEINFKRVLDNAAQAGFIVIDNLEVRRSLKNRSTIYFELTETSKRRSNGIFVKMSSIDKVIHQESFYHLNSDKFEVVVLKIKRAGKNPNSGYSEIYIGFIGNDDTIPAIKVTVDDPNGACLTSPILKRYLAEYVEHLYDAVFVLAERSCLVSLNDALSMCPPAIPAMTRVKLTTVPI